MSWAQYEARKEGPPPLSFNKSEAAAAAAANLLRQVRVIWKRIRHTRGGGGNRQPAAAAGENDEKRSHTRTCRERVMRNSRDAIRGAAGGVRVNVAAAAAETKDTVGFNSRKTKGSNSILPLRKLYDSDACLHLTFVTPHQTKRRLE